MAILTSVALVLSAFSVPLVYNSVDADFSRVNPSYTEVTTNYSHHTLNLDHILSAPITDYLDEVYFGYTTSSTYLCKVKHNFDYTTSNGDIIFYHDFSIEMPYVSIDVNNVHYNNDFSLSVTCRGGTSMRSVTFDASNVQGNYASFRLTSRWGFDVDADAEPVYDSWGVDFMLSLNTFDSSTIAADAYALGYDAGSINQNHWRLDNFLYSIVDLPVLYLRSLFGFDLYGGISIFAIITTLITIALVVFVVKKFI